MEIDETALTKSIGDKQELSVHFNVVEGKYSGNPIIFLNYFDSPGMKIWDNPPPNADAVKWEQGLLFPVNPPASTNPKLLLEPSLMVINENGAPMDIQRPENRRWLVMKENPKYPLLIAAGGFCYILLASFMLL